MMIKVSTSMGKFSNIGFRLKSKIKLQYSTSLKHFKNIPVIINNFNRLEYPKQLIGWLEAAGMHNIYIIDNASTYSPVLEWYKITPHTVFQLDKNLGFEALWRTVIFQRFVKSYYIYTDPDIVPKEDCPLNAVELFINLLQKYPEIDKVGFGLAIDDLPEYYTLKPKVVNWENRFWQHEIEKDIFIAPIDTTFALYRPGAKGGSELKALRTGGRYIARHLPWYIDPECLSAEEKYYIEHSGNSGSWVNELMNRKRNIAY
jgi:hypothetical protein